VSYVKQLVRPILTTRRHYYEDWLSRVNQHPKQPQSTEEAGASMGEADTLSLCKANTELKLGKTYMPADLGICW
jgi:hypothetical protein